MADNKSCEDQTGVDYSSQEDKTALSITMTADCSDAIKGLKAVQREARKTSAALKELEKAYNKIKPAAEQCGVSEQELVGALLGVRGDRV